MLINTILVFYNTIHFLSTDLLYVINQKKKFFLENLRFTYVVAILPYICFTLEYSYVSLQLNFV